MTCPLLFYANIFLYAKYVFIIGQKPLSLFKKNEQRVMPKTVTHQKPSLRKDRAIEGSTEQYLVLHHGLSSLVYLF